MSFGVGYVVNEHASPNNASAAGEVVDAVFLGVLGQRDIIVFQTVVIEASILVAPVPETIPLGTTLSVDMDEVVESDEAEGLQVFQGVFWCLAQETGFVDAF